MRDALVAGGYLGVALETLQEHPEHVEVNAGVCDALEQLAHTGKLPTHPSLRILLRTHLCAQYARHVHVNCIGSRHTAINLTAYSQQSGFDACCICDVRLDTVIMKPHSISFPHSCHGAEENRQRLGGAGVCEAVCEALRRHEVAAQVVRATCKCLARLAQLASNRRLILALGVVECIVGVMETHKRKGRRRRDAYSRIL